MKNQQTSFAMAKHIFSLVMALFLVWLGVTIKHSSVEANSSTGEVSQLNPEQKVNK